MTTIEEEQFHQLAFYTLSHKSTEFIHQYVVDAFTAQTATKTSKPISVFFALAGLYLHLEKNYSGRQVQQAHVRFSKKTKEFPSFILPEFRGAIDIGYVLAASPGPARDLAIQEWCKTVWGSYRTEHEKIAVFTERLLK